MLKVLRDNIKYLSWILWVVIGLFVLFVFVDFGAGGLRGGGLGGGNWAAKVGGETVSMEDFADAYRAMDRQNRQRFGEQYTEELAKQMQLPLRAVQQLVSERIMIAEAHRLGLTVSDDEVRDTILKIPTFQDKDGNFSEENYTNAVQNGFQLPVVKFEREVRKDILLRKLENALAAGIYVSDDEVEQSYKGQVEKAKIRYLELPRNKFLQGAPIPPAELTSYFEAHKQEYRLPEQREAAYLLVDGAQLMAQAKVDDGEVRAYYDAHKDEFTQQEQVRARQILIKVNDQRPDDAAKKRIDEIKKRLDGGADFATVAREVSEDEVSKANGGDLGFLGHGRVFKEVEDAALAAEPGKVVGPVKSAFGYHLLLVSEKRPAGLKPFDDVKDQIHSRLAMEAAQKLAETRGKELAAKVAKNKPKSADELAAFAKDAPGIVFAKTGPFGQQQPVSNVGFSPAFNQAAFAMKKGDVSEALQVPRGWAVFYLDQIHEAHVPELKEVEPRVRLAVAQQKMQQMAMDQLTAKRKELDQGKTLDQVAAELGLTVKETPEFGSQGGMIPGLGPSPELVKAALSLDTGKLGGPVADAQGAVLFQVTDRKSWDPKQFATAREQTRNALQQEKLGLLMQSLLEQRRREMGVSFSPQFLQIAGINQDPTKRS